MDLPLLLESHFFTKVSVEANTAFQPGVDDGTPCDIETEVRLARHKKDPHRWQVTLELRTRSPVGKQPYKIDLECVGLFKVSPEIEEGKVRSLVGANGAAILYSSAREFLLLVTGRGPWEPIYLPTTNFLPSPQAKEKIAEQQTSEPERPSPKIRKRRASPKG